MFSALALFICAYLVGALPLAYWIGRKGYDLSQEDYGPGSVGPAKLLRLGGPEAMVLSLLTELVKGFFVGYLTGYFQVSPALQWFSAIFMMAGHGWSPVIQCRGGNGWVPFTGFLIWIAPELAQVSLAAAFSGLALARSPSIGASSAMLVLGILGLFINLPAYVVIVLWLAATIVVFQNWLIRYHRIHVNKI